jgi:hypothetical protein
MAIVNAQVPNVTRLPSRLAGWARKSAVLVAIILPMITSIEIPANALARDADVNSCNLSRINRSCTLAINRAKPTAPTTLQNHSGQTFVVVHPNTHDGYFLDYTSGAATRIPDVTSTIVQPLFPFPQMLVVQSRTSGFTAAPAPAGPCAGAIVTGTTMPAHGSLNTALAPFRACLGDFANKAKDVYMRVEPHVAPGSITAMPTLQAQLTPASLTLLETTIDAVLRQELAVSGNITTLIGDSYRAEAAAPAKSATPTSPAMNAKAAIYLDPADTEAVAELAGLQKVADGIAADLMAYRHRLTDVESASAQNVEATVSFMSLGGVPAVCGAILAIE